MVRTYFIARRNFKVDIRLKTFQFYYSFYAKLIYVVIWLGRT